MMPRLREVPGRLYRGEISVNIVHRQKLWYAISGCILVISIIALAVRGLNFSVDFKGGAVFEFPATSSSATVQGQISKTISNAGGGSSTVQHVHTLGSLATNQWTAQTGVLNPTQTSAVEDALEKAFHFSQNALVVTQVGPTWGGTITDKALEALIIFLVVIVLYLTIAFEWKMAAAAFVALLHDILITVGVYAIVGFSVSPTTVIGLLTILGYSLYDTVVVFDKVRENTAGLTTSMRSTYSDAANLALNQTLVRSLNTSLTALIPVASILFIGGGLLGTGTLNDLSLVLFVGMLSGTYSSIFIATPVLAGLKEREPRFRELAMKIQRRNAGGRNAQRSGDVAAAAGTAAPVVTVGADQSDAVRDDFDTDMTDVDENIPADGDEMTVSSAASRPGVSGARPTSRQQPRRGGSAQRRPGARKKRR
jgi:preprotein translocase subunit SecF